MIWEPFVLALFLGLIVSAGLYFAYLWPSVEPLDPVEEPAGAREDSPVTAATPDGDADGGDGDDGDDGAEDDEPASDAASTPA